MLYALSGRIGLSLGFFQLRFFLESAVEGTCDTIDVSSGFSLFTSHASTGLSFNKFIVMLKGGWLLCIYRFLSLLGCSMKTFSSYLDCLADSIQQYRVNTRKDFRSWSCI